VRFESVLRWFEGLSAVQAILLFLVQNALVFVGAILLGNSISRRWSHRRVVEEVLGERSGELTAGAVVVLMNSVVTMIGWLLWRTDTIQVSSQLSPVVLVEVAIFTLLLDGFMYLGHRVGHHRVLYPLIHRFHHKYVTPRAATLFAIHPVEALGFGSLWIGALWAASAIGYAASAFSIGTFMLTNLLFGILGHSGVDPLPDRVRGLRIFRWIPTPAFHIGHHLNPACNLGFFTTMWDRVFDTIDPEYDPIRRRPLVPLTSNPGLPNTSL
jgi:Delta7-sterol 5-desaturase